MENNHLNRVIWRQRLRAVVLFGLVPVIVIGTYLLSFVEQHSAVQSRVTVVVESTFRGPRTSEHGQWVVELQANSRQLAQI